MSNILNGYLEKWLNRTRKPRAVIEEKPPNHPAGEARKECRIFVDRLGAELSTIGMVDRLLDAPLVEFNSDFHTKVTLGPINWLNPEQRLSIIFCNKTTKPICAYFKDIVKKDVDKSEEED